MAKVRVYELAKEFGVESKVVLAKLGDLGEFVRSASSTVEAPVVRKLREAFADAPVAPPAKKAAPAKAAAKTAAKKVPAGTASSPAPLRCWSRSRSRSRRRRKCRHRRRVLRRFPTYRPLPRRPQARSRDRPPHRSASARRPRPGNNPYGTESTGMGRRPTGPRPGNNPFSAGGTTGMQRPQTRPDAPPGAEDRAPLPAVSRPALPAVVDQAVRVRRQE